MDFKVEFGLTAGGTLLLADVIDNDSWRVLEGGAHIDKQAYRDGGALDSVAEKYRHVAAITGHFRLPRQQVILWRGSDKDDLSPLIGALEAFCGDGTDVEISTVTCSIHKEPVRGLSELHELVQRVPDSVVIAHIGRSNGAGPSSPCKPGRLGRLGPPGRGPADPQNTENWQKNFSLEFVPAARR